MIRVSRRGAAMLAMLIVLGAGCSTARGPVDRSVDAAHATNRTIGETAHSATELPEEPGNAVVGVLTAPFRLVGRLGESLFGP